MSEHKIDNYFREHLKGVEEPILPNDFSEFEKFAINKRSGNWLYLLLLLPIFGVATYFFYPTSRHTDLSEALKIVEETERKDNHLGDNQTTNSQTERFKQETKTNGATESTVNRKLRVFGNQLSKKNGTNQTIGSGSKNLHTTHDNYGNNNIQQNELNELDRLTKTSNSNDNSEMNEPYDLEQQLQKTLKPVVIAAISTGTQGNNGGSNNSESTAKQAKSNFGNYKFSRTNDTEVQFDKEYEMLEIIGLSQIETNNIPQFDSDKKKQIEFPPIKLWNIQAFAQYEFNNELGGVLSAGLISNWQKNKLNIGIGIGIGQTGTLNWTQSRQEIDYGFDVYEENYQLRTKNFTFISMPLHLAYQVLPRSEVFIGLAPEIIINASQAYKTTESGEDQSTGYLYNTGAPSLLLFMNVGYSYSLTDFLKIDIGMNYSPQNWDVTERKPLGGVIRLKYNIR